MTPLRRHSILLLCGFIFLISCDNTTEEPVSNQDTKSDTGEVYIQEYQDLSSLLEDPNINFNVYTLELPEAYELTTSNVEIWRPSEVIVSQYFSADRQTFISLTQTHPLEPVLYDLSENEIVTVRGQVGNLFSELPQTEEESLAQGHTLDLSWSEGGDLFSIRIDLSYDLTGGTENTEPSLPPFEWTEEEILDLAENHFLLLQ